MTRIKTKLTPNIDNSRNTATNATCGDKRANQVCTAPRIPDVIERRRILGEMIEPSPSVQTMECGSDAQSDTVSSHASASKVAYTYDGTLEGLLSCVFAAYANREDPADIMPADSFQPRLGQAVRSISTDLTRAERVRVGVCRNCGPAGFAAVRTASLSDNPTMSMTVYRFIRHGMAQNRPHSCAGCKRQRSCSGTGEGNLGLCSNSAQPSTLNDLSHPAVAGVRKLVREATCEAERMRQFIRFEHMDNGVWFARCNPKASVVPLIMSHFAARFNTQPFIIYDETHHLAGVSENGTWQLVRTDEITLPGYAPDEAPMRRAWKRFYDSVSVESRYHPELQRQFMPMRLWKNITEMQEALPRAVRASEQQYIGTSAHDALSADRLNQTDLTPVQSKGGMKLSLAASPTCQ
ncbi:TIGR03915 family putative DNA repair protein [Adlercreutzia sp. ZJ141]|uniref:TIGR03915 family putative DNA repair protein n=1 Tax=Adlercreutzia sp. ZJ141 TaxID=2709406 RepID=UPI001F14E943|nr:TIGR03915 family putative DNA repair protein [Adlercreutzia sp. ZJ141]